MANENLLRTANQWVHSQIRDIFDSNYENPLRYNQIYELTSIVIIYYFRFHDMYPTYPICIVWYTKMIEKIHISLLATETG